MLQRLVIGGFTLAFVALCSTSAAAAPAGKGKKVRVGLGGSLGDPIGPSLKLFLAPQHALQFEFGYGTMHHGDGVLHANYLFHIRPFVQHKVFDFGMYLGAGLGMAFWSDRDRRGTGYHCHGGDCHYHSFGHHGRRGDFDHGGAALIMRAPVFGLFFHWQPVPLDTVLEGSWAPYLVHWDPSHGDVSVKLRYYF